LPQNSFRNPQKEAPKSDLVRPKKQGKCLSLGRVPEKGKREAHQSLHQQLPEKKPPPPRAKKGGIVLSPVALTK